MNFLNKKLGIILGLASVAMTQGTVSLPEELAAANAQVVPVKVGLAYSEGPAIDSAGNIFFSEDPDVTSGRIWKITPGGEEEAFYDPGNSSNGLEFDPQWRLVSCQSGKLVRFESDGQITELASDSKNNENFGRINDLSIGSNGSIYFTNLNGGKVFYLDSTGNLKSFNYSGPNGIEWIEERNIIYIAHSGRLEKCTPEENGDISNCQEFASASSPDGLTLDENYNVYLANWSLGRITVWDSTGASLGYIEVEAEMVQGKRGTNGLMGNTSNCIFGGPEGKTLYITGDGGLYKVEMNVKGRKKPWLQENSTNISYFKTVSKGQSVVQLKPSLFQNWAEGLGFEDWKLIQSATGKKTHVSGPNTPAKGAYTLLGKDKNGVQNQIPVIIK